MTVTIGGRNERSLDRGFILEAVLTGFAERRLRNRSYFKMIPRLLAWIAEFWDTKIYFIKYFVTVNINKLRYKAPKWRCQVTSWKLWFNRQELDNDKWVSGMQTAEIRSTREVREDSPVLLESQAIHKQVKETEKDQPGYRRKIRFKEH